MWAYFYKTMQPFANLSGQAKLSQILHFVKDHRHSKLKDIKVFCGSLHIQEKDYWIMNP